MGLLQATISRVWRAFACIPHRGERWFADLTARKLRHGVHRSLRELNAHIRDWLAHWNEDPHPFIWTKTTDQILETIAGYCNHIADSRH